MEFDNSFLDLVKVLEDINDIELSLLKCHLLIEQELDRVALIGAEKPKYISESRLTFSNKIALVRAFHDSKCESWVWGALNKLNKVRNLMAHNLSSTEIEIEITAYTILLKNEEKIWPAELLKVKHPDFFWAVFLILSKLRGIV
ncbi:hypothetical protein KO525_05285 [Psychrosphaera sp. B3R10]|uniref:hypothetical protein n=1 Tax=unclassified Psychrosphaera TaxID=2641570 RepID=UPI001C096633|nr:MULTISPECIES: hypothetical protein [unclassified Psychrosphaera]MBU2881995.1 hypothetical protein [Psychrosphaera sp. I2R16]MBU2988787.1 hypothetical protein [Psychrosphaera sp. B3R10]